MRADADAVSAVLTAAGIAAWGSFLGAERVAAASEGRTHPADLVAEDEQGVFAFVAWDTGTGEISRLLTAPRAPAAPPGRAVRGTPRRMRRPWGRS